MINALKFSKVRLAFFTIVVGLYLIGARTAFGSDTLAYFQDNNGEFGTIDLNTGQTTIINPNNTLEAGYGLGVANSILYYTTSNNSGVYGAGQLWSINPATGAATFIGKSDLNYAAFGSTSNGLFAYVIGGPIASINPTTGVATEIGAAEGAQFPILSTSKDSSSLYEINEGVGTLNRYFWGINTANGSVTQLGTSLSSNDWAAMVYMNGTLYAILQAGIPNAPFATYTINTSTGITTQYGSNLPTTQPYIMGLAPYPLPPTPGTWYSIPGAIISTPAIAWNPTSSKIQMVVRGNGNTIWSSTLDSSGIFNNDWTQIAGAIISPPALAWNPTAGKMQMVVQGSGNTIWSATFDSTGTFNNDWTQITGSMISPPALAWNTTAGKMQMVVQGSGNTIWSATFSSTGTFNNDWTQITGAMISPPALAWNTTAGKMQMVVQGSGNTIWSATFSSTGTFNNDWTQLSGAIISSPALAWDSVNNKLQMVVQGSGNTIWSATFSSTGSFNNDWTQMAGAIIDRPAIASDPVLGRLMIVVRGTSNSIWAMAH